MWLSRELGETPASIGSPIGSRAGSARWNSTTGPRPRQTAALLYEHLDFLPQASTRLPACYPAASLEAIRSGFQSVGVEDDSVLLFSGLMDSASVFLTATATPSTSWASLT